LEKKNILTAKILSIFLQQQQRNQEQLQLHQSRQANYGLMLAVTVSTSCFGFSLPAAGYH